MPARRSFPGSRAMALLALVVLARTAQADSVKPLMFGPFFLNQISGMASPAGYDYVLSNGLYHFQAGWIEPIGQGRDGFFNETYFETNGNLNVSPFTTDIGTTFNLKPIRYLEVGLSYNRMMFHNSLVSFATLPDERQYRPDEIISHAKELGGADIFTYQANLTFDFGPAQLYLQGSRALWDTDAKGKSFFFEYGDGLILSTRGRVNKFLAQTVLDLQPKTVFRAISFIGFAIRDQYWMTDESEDGQGIERNLVSAGITGLRFGRNSRLQRRGLDLSVGFWTLHDQIPKGDFAKSLVLVADWQWNIHVLKI